MHRSTVQKGPLRIFSTIPSEDCLMCCHAYAAYVCECRYLATRKRIPIDELNHRLTLLRRKLTIVPQYEHPQLHHGFEVFEYYSMMSTVRMMRTSEKISDLLLLLLLLLELKIPNPLSPAQPNPAQTDRQTLTPSPVPSSPSQPASYDSSPPSPCPDPPSRAQQETAPPQPPHPQP